MWRMFGMGQHYVRFVFAVKQCLSDHFVASSAESFGDQDIVDGGFGFLPASTDQHAFAGGETVGFDDVGRFLLCQVALGRSGVSEGSKSGGRYAVIGEDFFRERFAAFELRGGLIRPESSPAARVK